MAVDDGVHIGVEFGWSSGGIEASNHIFGVQALGVGDALLLIDAGENDVVGEAQAFDQIGFEHFAAKRVGARLEHGPEARLRIDGAQCAQGFADGRGVMGEVVDDGDAGDLGAHFEAALDAFEAGERGLNCFLADALAGGERGGGGGVERVVFAGKTHLQARPRERRHAADFPTGEAVFVAQVADSPVGFGGEAIAFDRQKASATHSVTLALPS